MKAFVLACLTGFASLLVPACGGSITSIPDGSAPGTDGASGGHDSGSGNGDSGSHDGSPSDSSTTSDSPVSSDSGTDTGKGSDTGGGGGPCPSTEPTAGHACSPTDLECQYGDNPNLNCDQLFRCEPEGWVKIAGGGSCPPESDCPASYPGGTTMKATCDESELDLTCSYAQGTCICSDGSLPMPGGPSWQCFPATSKCPSPRPKIGSPCSDNGTTCDYGACEGGVELQCTGGIWQVVETPCPG
jgi:hypothetical protein